MVIVLTPVFCIGNNRITRRHITNNAITEETSIVNQYKKLEV